MLYLVLFLSCAFCLLEVRGLEVRLVYWVVTAVWRRGPGEGPWSAQLLLVEGGFSPFFLVCFVFVFVVYKPAQYSLLLTYFIEGVAGAGACPLVLVPGLPPRLFEEWAAVCFIVAGPFLPVLVSLICLYLSSVYLFVVRDARDHLDSRGRICLYAHGPGRWPRSLFTSPPNRPGVGTRLYEKPSPGKPGIEL